MGFGASGLILPKNDLIEQKKVKIYDNYIRGLQFTQFNKIAEKIKEGDSVVLKREADNEYDSFAIAILWEDIKIGYIAAYENIVLANMLDAGSSAEAFVSQVDRKRNIYNQVSVEIFTTLILPLQKAAILVHKNHRADDAEDEYRERYL